MKNLELVTVSNILTWGKLDIEALEDIMTIARDTFNIYTSEIEQYIEEYVFDTKDIESWFVATLQLISNEIYTILEEHIEENNIDYLLDILQTDRDNSYVYFNYMCSSYENSELLDQIYCLETQEEIIQKGVEILEELYKNENI